MNAAGTILGGISLAIQLSGVCLKGYDVIKASLEHSEDSRFLSIQFDIERSRLQLFVQAAGLTDGAPEISAGGRHAANADFVNKILSAIRLALAQYTAGKDSQRVFAGQGADSIPLDELSLNHDLVSSAILNCSSDIPVSPGLFCGLTWTLYQKKESEKVLQRLGRMNDLLHESLDADGRRYLRYHQLQRNMELVQLQTSLDDIKGLAAAAHASKVSHAASKMWQHSADAELEDLATFKALYTSLISDTSSQRNGLELQNSQIHVGKEQNYHQGAMYRNGDEEKSVWINWRPHDPTGAPTSAYVSRLEELTMLLMAPKPDEFCILTWLGYSILQRIDGHNCPALVFEKPRGVNLDAEPVSLFQALVLYPEISLTSRIALAQKVARCVLYLHAVNWLHKALRSSNVILFSGADSTLDSENAFLTGFDNTRRSGFNEQTTEVPREGRMEVYRHPDTQVDGPRLPYRKTFDIYSLGLILAEIAIWKPMVTIMDIGDAVDRSTRATRTIQERWLHSEPALLKLVEAEVGKKYASAVATCLKGRDAFGIGQRDAETGVETGIKIQREFNSDVVKVLAKIVV